MKKHEFYSMMLKDNKKQAVKHEGYTDGVYNYYKGASQWFAIVPAVGLSVCQAYTRKEAAAQAHKLTQKVKERLQAIPGAIEEFTRFRSEAKITEV